MPTLEKLQWQILPLPVEPMEDTSASYLHAKALLAKSDIPPLARPPRQAVDFFAMQVAALAPNREISHGDSRFDREAVPEAEEVFKDEIMVPVTEEESKQEDTAGIQTTPPEKTPNPTNDKTKDAGKNPPSEGDGVAALVQGDRWLDRKQVAAKLRLGMSTVSKYAAIDPGFPKGFLIGLKARRWSEKGLEEWMRAQGLDQKQESPDRD